MEAMALPPSYMGNHDLVKAFLHSMYKKHLVMKKTYSDERNKSGFRKLLQDHEMKITINGAELFFLMPSSTTVNQSNGNGSGDTDSLHFLKRQDNISLHLPTSLQPGYNRDDFPYECEDMHSPILPLLRCLGPAKTIRVLSALLCEHRIIFISKNTEMLSACVTACTAMLAQGLLIWRHVQIPVLPPHLFRFLTTGAPYIVGVLEKYCERIEKLSCLKDIIYIDLDNGLLKTLYMPDAQKKVPDLLLNQKRIKNNSAVDELVNDFQSILHGEREIWASIEASVEKEDDTEDAATGQPAQRRTSRSFMGKLGFAMKENNGNGENSKSTGENNGGDFFQQAEFFVKNFFPQSTVALKKSISEIEEDEEKIVFSYSEKGKSTQRYRAYAMSDNERGEELARASLVCFFLELFGDMGMYLSVDKNDESSFRLDVKKFLVRKRQLGAKDDTSMYLLLKRLTRSITFESFIEGRIADVKRNPSHQIMISHKPLFQLCQEHMRRQKTKFFTSNIRKVVFTTISACMERNLIDTRKEVRERSLALTSEKPFEGDEVVALKALIDICKGCDLAFSQVMQVIWLRIREDRPTLWKRPLLGLHLLRNFLLHGVSFSLGLFIHLFV